MSAEFDVSVKAFPWMKESLPERCFAVTVSGDSSHKKHYWRSKKAGIIRWAFLRNTGYLTPAFLRDIRVVRAPEYDDITKSWLSRPPRAYDVTREVEAHIAATEPTAPKNTDSGSGSIKEGREG